MFELGSNLHRSGHDSILFLPRLGNPNTQTSAKVIEIPFIDFPFLRPLSFHVLCALVLLFQSFGAADIFYVRQMNSFLPHIIAKLKKIPVIYEIPNDIFGTLSPQSKMKRAFVSWIDRMCIRMSKKIIVLSEWSKERLHRLGGVHASKILVLPSGTDIKHFKPENKKDSCRQIGLDPELFYIGFVGSFFDYQGVDTLIRAAPIILSETGRLKFLLVGDGPMMDSWKNSVVADGLQDHFIFTGQVPYKSVPLYISAMDMCVAPHTKISNQSSPVKIFDYMSCARPIIASNLGVVREIIKNSGCALLVPPGEARSLAQNAIRLIADEQLRNEMGKNGREFACHNYDRSKISNDFIKMVFKLRSETS